MMSAFIVTSFVALHEGTPTVNSSLLSSAVKPSDLRVEIIVSFEISIPVYLSTKAFVKLSSTLS